MVYLCRGKECGKSFPTTFNRNKHEKTKGHWSEMKITVIKCNKESRLFVCPTAGCSTTSQSRSNIVNINNHAMIYIHNGRLQLLIRFA